VFLGNRHSRPGCRFRRAGWRPALAGLSRHMIVGVGLYQGVEFLLQSSALDLLAKRTLFTSRVRRATTLMRRAEAYDLDLGPDTERNADEILAFLDRRGLGEARGEEAPPPASPGL
jgi:hypothetical protein